MSLQLFRSKRFARVFDFALAIIPVLFIVSSIAYYWLLRN